MDQGVDNGFEDGAVAVLGHVAARRFLAGGDATVARDEPHRVPYLLVEGCGDVQRVQLPIPILPAAIVADRLNERARQPFAGVPAGQEHASHCRSDHPLGVLHDEPELAQRDLVGVSRPRAGVPTPQLGVQGGYAGTGDDLGVGRLDAHVAVPPKPPDLGRRHEPLAVPSSAEEPTRRTMHGAARWHLHHQHTVVGRFGRWNSVKAEVQRRLDAVGAQFRHEIDDRVQLCGSSGWA